MRIVHKNKSVIKNKAHSKESGFVILMGLLVLILGAAAWFGTAGNLRSEGMKLSSQSVHVVNLERIKEKMLTYAVFHPELFAPQVNVPGPGYFPCPDTSGNGQTDTGTNCVAAGALFAIGMVPIRLANRNFSFLSSSQQQRRYWFAVDSRYLVRPGGQRVGSLNTLTSAFVDTTGGSFCDDDNPPGPTNPLPATCVAPLTVDGQGDIIMVLFYAGDAINQQVRPVNAQLGYANTNMNRFLEQPVLPTLGQPANFVSVGNNPDTFNDYVITITKQEWEATMLSRVSSDVNSPVLNGVPNGVPDLCDIPVGNNWFDNCIFGAMQNYPCTIGAGNNLEGQGWRFALGC